MFSRVTDWLEDTWEAMRQKKLAAQLLSAMQNRPREGLVKIGLAIALAPYSWPGSSTSDDEGMARARERYLALFGACNDEDLKSWIKEHVRDMNSVLLKVSLDLLREDISA
jgi:hypothetical protein